MAKLPDYLASINFRCPGDPDNALFQYALNTKLNMFQWLEMQPDQLAAFSAYNAASTKRRGPVLRASISALLSANGPATPSEGAQIEKDQVLLADVGAGRDQVLGDIRKDRLYLVGRIIAQDLPEVIAGRENAEGVEDMAFDFFQPQPVKGEYPLPSYSVQVLYHIDYFIDGLVFSILANKAYKLMHVPQGHLFTSSATSFTIGPTSPAARSSPTPSLRSLLTIPASSSWIRCFLILALRPFPP